MSSWLLKLCSGLLRLCLPLHVADALIGDLYEEYNTKRLDGGVNKAQMWLLSQTARSIWPFLLSTSYTLRAIMMLQGLFVFMVLAIAIMYLSNMDDASRLSVEFWPQWMAGKPHQLFLEQDFWQFAFARELHESNIQMWLNPLSMAYAGLAWMLIKRFEKQIKPSLIVHLFFVAGLMALPYLWGVLIFILFQPEIRLTGPIVVSMWFPILYLVLPLSWSLANSVSYRLGLS
ncbi:hypothetical protein [uncultured Pseudoteredinibacter sp.]|uniref:hypothetical protein n=1 Tax=uncultured Pseudoteredinibacter sp. TaxID=1641701 RepID=UPI00261146A4|nr:hypothetical protein [uncultured Pseudoteredinibacter sp.]